MSFTGTPVDDTDNADNGALTFGNYETVRAFVIENTVEHYDSRVDVNKLKNKGGHTVVSNIFFVIKQSSKQLHNTINQKDCNRTLFIWISIFLVYT